MNPSCWTKKENLNFKQHRQGSLDFFKFCYFCGLYDIDKKRILQYFYKPQKNKNISAQCLY